MNTWLPIKKEYIIENYESLLLFLTDANYNNKNDKFLCETIERLHEVATSIVNENFSHLLGVTDEIDEVWERNLKIVATSIYASYKWGFETSELFIGILDTLVINHIIDNETAFKKARNILVKLANNILIKNLPYSLKNLSETDFNPRLFATQLLSVQFDEGKLSTLIFETKGQCIFKKDDIDIIPLTSENLKKTKIKLLDKIGLNVNIFSSDKKRLAGMEFPEQVANLSLRLITLTNNTPDTSPKLKTYQNDAIFFVEVQKIDINRGKIICRSLDPLYETVELELKIPYYHQFNPYVVVQNSKFIEYLKIGQKLKVNFFEKDGKQYFSFINQLNDYYFDIDDLNIQQAIFANNYSIGTRWITELGKIVNIMTNPNDYQIQEAQSIDSQYSIEIRYNSVNTDKKGSKIINAERIGELKSVNRDDFLHDAVDNLVVDIYEYWDLQCPAYINQYLEERRAIPSIYVMTLCHLLAMRSENMELSHFERYMTTFAAASLAIILDNNHDISYCEYNLQFLRALWAFAEDTANKWLTPAIIPDDMASIESINQKNQVLKILSTYKEGINFKLTDIDNSINVDRISHLVEASNTLIGNISSFEINRIKRTICRCLGIESLYKERPSEKYWFGEESDMLEFKSSIVFPPFRKGTEIPNPDPNIQIWQIIKTINGFFNSVHGGTLLLGVNDYGNASGIEDDIDWLYKNNQILTNTVDRYIQYIKIRVDNAFEAYRRNDKGREITSTRIQYTSFQTDGYTILRVDVMPYEMGCVKICDTLNISNTVAIKKPNFIKEAYIRNTIATEKLTDNLRHKVESDKRSVIKDSEKQSLISIQEAIDTNKMIKLKNYQSSNGVSNRIIEPIDLLPLRGLVIGIEKGKTNTKIFKLIRCSSVEVLEESFKPSTKYTYRVDPFNMLASGSSKQFKIYLKLTRFAWLLLKESHPYTTNYINEENDPDFPYSLKCEISDVRGIGSFCMSVLGNFKIIEGTPLEKYLRETCSQFK